MRSFFRANSRLYLIIIREIRFVKSKTKAERGWKPVPFEMSRKPGRYRITTLAPFGLTIMEEQSAESFTDPV